MACGQRLQVVQQPGHGPGQHGNAAHQQQADGQVRGKWYAKNGRSARQYSANSYQNNTYPAFARLAGHGAQAFQGLRGRQCLRGARGPPAPHQCSQHTQCAVDQGRRCAPLQYGLNARKVATAQVAPQQAQRGSGQGRAQGDAGGAAHQAQHGGFGQHQRQALARCGAQHGQQRKLRRTLRHAERQHREHQKCAREQGHQRQHREVHAVGARQIADALRRVARLRKHHLRRPAGQRAHGLLPRAAVCARLQLQVNAAELAHAAKQILRSADIHHRQGCAPGGHRARHLHRPLLQPGLQKDLRCRFSR
ncbi:hypothetical protein D3C71_1090560 [compost metagenome]